MQELLRLDPSTHVFCSAVRAPNKKMVASAAAGRAGIGNNLKKIPKFAFLRLHLSRTHPLKLQPGTGYRQYLNRKNEHLFGRSCFVLLL